MLFRITLTLAAQTGFEPVHAGVMAIGGGTDPPSACTLRALPLDDPMKSCALPLGYWAIYYAGKDFHLT